MSRKKKKARWQQRPQKSGGVADSTASTEELSKSDHAKVSTSAKSSRSPRAYAALERRVVITIGIVVVAIATSFVVPSVRRSWSIDRLAAVAPENYQAVLASKDSQKEKLLVLATIPETQTQALEYLRNEQTPFSTWRETHEWAKQLVDAFPHADVRDRRATIIFLQEMGDAARPFVNPIGLATADPDASIAATATVLANKLNLDLTNIDFVNYAAPILNTRVMQMKAALDSESPDSEERVVSLEASFTLMEKIAPRSPDTVLTLRALTESYSPGQMFTFAVAALQKAVPDWLNRIEDQTKFETSLVDRLQSKHTQELQTALDLARRMQSSSFDLFERIVPLTCHDSERVRASAFGLVVGAAPTLLPRESEAMLQQLSAAMQRLKESPSNESRGPRLGRALLIVSSPPDPALLVGLLVRLFNEDERSIIVEALDVWIPGFSSNCSLDNLGLQDLLTDNGAPGIISTFREREVYFRFGAAALDGEIDMSKGLLARRIIELCAADVCRAVDNADFERRYQKWKAEQPNSTISVTDSSHGIEIKSKVPNPMFELYGLYSRDQFRISESLSPGRSTIDSPSRNTLSILPRTPVQRIAASPLLQTDYRARLKVRINAILSAMKRPVTQANDSQQR